VRLDVQFIADEERLLVRALTGTLSEELSKAIAEHKAALLCFARIPYVEAIDGLGMLMRRALEQDVSFVGPDPKAAFHYKIGVAGLFDRVKRFYWPRMVSLD
jgi:hypothetical protein